MNINAKIWMNFKTNRLNILFQGAILLAGLLVINIVIFGFDQRMLGDEYLWIKPIKFEVSVMMHFMTLAVLATLLTFRFRESKSWGIWSYAVVIAGLFEVLYIFLQAARGRESHFNKNTQIEEILYGLMGVGAVVLVGASFYLGYKLYREYQVNRNDPLLLSCALGLMLGSILTLIIAGYLSSVGGEGISNDPNSSIRVPFFGWYLNGQDIRIPHFFATHMMQIMPFIGWWLLRSNTVASVCIKQIKIIALLISISVFGLFCLNFF